MAGTYIYLSKKQAIAENGNVFSEVYFQFTATRTLRARLATSIMVNHKLCVTENEVPVSPLKLREIKKGPLKAQCDNVRNTILELKAYLEKQYNDSGKQFSTSRELKDWLADVADRHLHKEKYMLLDKQRKERERAAQEKARKDSRATLMKIVNSYVDDAINGRILRDGKRVSKGTIANYKQTRTRLNRFLQAQGKQDYDTDELTEQWYNKLVSFLYAQGMVLNTIGAVVKGIKLMLRQRLPLAQRATCEFIQTGKCKVLREEVNNIYLNEEQLAYMASYPFTGHLKKVRDQFLLMCWTGCRYSDLHKLTDVNIHTTKDGANRYFEIEQQKTGAVVAIPIIPEIEPILNEYAQEPPKPISNQKFNNYIKVVCQELAATPEGEELGYNDDFVKERTKNAEKETETQKIYEVVSAHTARRSFATNMYRRDMPVPLIMSITGHTTEKTFFTYIKEDPREGRERMVENYFKLRDHEQTINI